jgi:hypothetical protein
MDMWYPHTRFASTHKQSALYISFIYGVAHFMTHDGMVPCHLLEAK